jgi:hypothetical protein
MHPNWDFWFENKPSGNPDRTWFAWTRIGGRLQSCHIFLGSAYQHGKNWPQKYLPNNYENTKTGKYTIPPQNIPTKWPWKYPKRENIPNDHKIYLPNDLKICLANDHKICLPNAHKNMTTNYNHQMTTNYNHQMTTNYNHQMTTNYTYQMPIKIPNDLKNHIWSSLCKYGVYDKSTHVCTWVGRLRNWIT